MHAFAAAGAGFLVAVLWFDLMFDVQARRQPGDTISPEALASISAYYRRVTTDARPMNRLIALVMGLTLLAIVVEIIRGVEPWWTGWASLAIAASAIGLALGRTIRNAVRLGAGKDSLDARARLARAVYQDHLYCFSAMVLVVGLQLAAQA